MRIVLPPWREVGRERAIAGLVAIGLLAVWMAIDDDQYLRVLDDANLAFHEAGHLIYALFGDTAALYGGTLGQLSFPLVVVAVLFVRRDPLGCAIGAAWAGQNLGNIARYAADARAQELPLVGGGDHDWANILARWGALSADQRVASALRTVGWALVLGAAAWLAWRWWRDPRDPHDPRDPPASS